MRTLTFTDEEWEYVEAFLDAPREWYSHGARMIQDALRRAAQEDPTEPPVTGHDTVWLMAHEG